MQAEEPVRPLRPELPGLTSPHRCRGNPLAFFANFFVLERLVVPRDAATTVGNIADAEVLFRGGIVAFLAVFVLDAVIAWALYLYFAQVSRQLSLLAAWLRVVFAAISGAVLPCLVIALLLAGGGRRDPQAALFVDAYTYAWGIALVFFGLYLLLVGFLIVRSDYVPSIFGVLLGLAGLGYVVDNTARVLLPGYDAYADVLLLLSVVPAVIGELAFTGWLLFAGRRDRDAVDHPRDRVPVESALQGQRG